MSYNCYTVQPSTTMTIQSCGWDLNADGENRLSEFIRSRTFAYKINIWPSIRIFNQFLVIWTQCILTWRDPDLHEIIKFWFVIHSGRCALMWKVIEHQWLHFIQFWKTKFRVWRTHVSEVFKALGDQGNILSEDIIRCHNADVVSNNINLRSTMLLSLLICAALKRSWIGRNGLRRFGRFGRPSVPEAIISNIVNCIFSMISLKFNNGISFYNLPRKFSGFDYWLNLGIKIQYGWLQSKC